MLHDKCRETTKQFGSCFHWIHMASEKRRQQSKQRYVHLCVCDCLFFSLAIYLCTCTCMYVSMSIRVSLFSDIVIMKV